MKFRGAALVADRGSNSKQVIHNESHPTRCDVHAVNTREIYFSSGQLQESLRVLNKIFGEDVGKLHAFGGKPEWDGKKVLVGTWGTLFGADQSVFAQAALIPD